MSLHGHSPSFPEQVATITTKRRKDNDKDVCMLKDVGRQVDDGFKIAPVLEAVLHQKNIAGSAGRPMTNFDCPSSKIM